MTKQELNNIINTRALARRQFNTDFYNANNLQELIQAYAKYTGKLEGLLDMVELTDHIKEIGLYDWRIISILWTSICRPRIDGSITRNVDTKTNRSTYKTYDISRVEL